LYLLEATRQELPEAAGVLDLADDRFDHRFARRIDRGASLRVQLARHPINARRRAGQRTTGTRAGSLAVFLLPRRDSTGGARAGSVGLGLGTNGVL
jgi:hypothetical protein